MNVSEHCKERYVERIKGITDRVEIKQYLVHNNDRITDYIVKMHEYSTFIYKGQLNGDKSSRNFYIKDDTIFVTDTGDSCIITMYKVDFGFPEETTKNVIKDLLKEVENIKAKMEEEKNCINKFLEEKRYEIDTTEGQIANFEAQVNILKFKKQLAQDEITSRNNDFQLLNKQLERYAAMLCNSMAFKNDVLKIMK